MTIVRIMESANDNDTGERSWRSIASVMETVVGRVAIQSFATRSEGRKPENGSLASEMLGRDDRGVHLAPSCDMAAQPLYAQGTAQRFGK